MDRPRNRRCDDAAATSSPQSTTERAAPGCGDRDVTRPAIIEFAGTPRAGKTTAIEGVRERLHRDGYRVQVVEEQARHCSVPCKHNADFNRWTFASTMMKMVEAKYQGADVVLVDRGYFDTIAWNEWFHRSGQLSKRAYRAYGAALRAELTEFVGLVIVMTVSPDTAIQRDGRPAGDPGGSIINPGALTGINRAIRAAVDRSRSGAGFRMVLVDTTCTDRETMLDRVMEHVVAFVGGTRDESGRAGALAAGSGQLPLISGLDPLSTPV
jgi:predicted ATPase